MAWPGQKGRDEIAKMRAMSPEERRIYMNQKKMLAARGICNKCKELPRAPGNKTICNRCIWDHKKKKRKEKFIENRKAVITKVLSEFGFRCIKCDLPIEEIFTRKTKGRYLCGPCAVIVWKYCYANHLLVWKYLAEMRRQWRLAHGKLPKSAWETLPPNVRKED
jgi:hypothetical protein